MKNKILLLLALIGAALSAQAYDFTDVCTTGQTLYYNIRGNSAVVTHPNDAEFDEAWTGFEKPTGSVMIPDMVEHDGLFYNVTTIGAYAFCGCDSIMSFALPSTLTTMEAAAFWGCSRVRVLDIPTPVTSIGESAFGHCTSLGLIIYDAADCATFASSAFAGCDSVKQMFISNRVRRIPETAFFGLYSLKRIDYLGNLAEWCRIDFGANPLLYAKHLYIEGTEVYDLTIPASITRVMRNAFVNCLGLESVSMGPQVTAISEGAFNGCSELTSLQLGQHVDSISDWAFTSCSALASITSLNTHAPVIGGDATFYEVDKSIPLHVPEGSADEYRNAYGWREFANIVADIIAGIDAAPSVEASISVHGHEIAVDVPNSTSACLYGMDGRLVDSSRQGTLHAPATGVYLVQVGNTPARKVVVTQ